MPPLRYVILYNGARCPLLYAVSPLRYGTSYKNGYTKSPIRQSCGIGSWVTSHSRAPLCKMPPLRYDILHNGAWFPLLHDVFPLRYSTSHNNGYTKSPVRQSCETDSRVTSHSRAPLYKNFKLCRNTKY